MKLQIFTIRKFLRWALIILAVVNFNSDSKKNENYYPQMFLKEYKYIEKEEKSD